MHIFAHIQSLDYFSLVICHNNILLFNKALKNSILIQMKILKKKRNPINHSDSNYTWGLLVL
jgi:hypothetical protein